MGVIAKKIVQMRPKLDYVLRSIAEVNTARRQSQLERQVYDIFRALEPLNHTGEDVCTRRDEDSSQAAIRVARSLMVRSLRHSVGRTVNQTEFFVLTRRYGRRICEHVRGPIKSEYASLVELVEGLTPYDSIEVSRDVQTVEYRYQSEWKCVVKPSTTIYEYDNMTYPKAEVRLEPAEVRRVRLRTASPDRVAINDGDTWNSPHIELTKEKDITMIEDLLDDIVCLFREAGKKIEAVEAHNKPILEAMRRAVAPWLVATGLKT